MERPAPSPSLPTGTVTFLFTDLVGSTRLWDRFRDEMEAALARHDEIVRSSASEPPSPPTSPSTSARLVRSIWAECQSAFSKRLDESPNTDRERSSNCRDSSESIPSRTTCSDSEVAKVVLGVPVGTAT